MDTIKLPPQKPQKPTPRNYAKTTEEIELDLIKQRMYEIERNLAALNDEMDKTNETSIEKIAAIREGLKDLQKLIYGEPLYFLPGLGVQVKNMNLTLELIQADREAQVNQIKGMKMAVVALGVTGGGTLIGVLVQLFGGG